MTAFPLLLIPLTIFNILFLMMPGVVPGTVLFALPLPSGASWPVSLGDALVAVAIVLLWVEVVKAARPGVRSLMDHLLSLTAFVVAAGEFLLMPPFANSSFFLLTLLLFIEFAIGAGLGLRRRADRRRWSRMRDADDDDDGADAATAPPATPPAPPPRIPTAPPEPDAPLVTRVIADPPAPPAVTTTPVREARNDPASSA